VVQLASRRLKGATALMALGAEAKRAFLVCAWNSLLSSRHPCHESQSDLVEHETVRELVLLVGLTDVARETALSAVRRVSSSFGSHAICVAHSRTRAISTSLSPDLGVLGGTEQ